MRRRLPKNTRPPATRQETPWPYVSPGGLLMSHGVALPEITVAIVPLYLNTLYLPHMAHEVFRQFASKAARFVGLSWTFMLAVIIVIAWTVGGLLYGFSDTWLLVMNTVCSVTTFLVVFIIQNTQNRHTREMQLKLDELIKSQRAARNDLLDMEAFTDKELDALQKDFQSLSSEFADRRKAIIAKQLLKDNPKHPLLKRIKDALPTKNTQ